MSSTFKRPKIHSNWIRIAKVIRLEVQCLFNQSFHLQEFIIYLLLLRLEFAIHLWKTNMKNYKRKYKFKKINLNWLSNLTLMQPINKKPRLHVTWEKNNSYLIQIHHKINIHKNETIYKIKRIIRSAHPTQHCSIDFTDLDSSRIQTMYQYLKIHI